MLFPGDSVKTGRVDVVENNPALSLHILPAISLGKVGPSQRLLLPYVEDGIILLIKWNVC